MAGPAPSASDISYTLPPGWSVLPPPTAGQARQMEVARIGVAADAPAAVLTIVPLGGEGGGIIPNVARWEGQLKLPISTTEQQVMNLLAPLDTPFGTVPVVDLSSPAGALKTPERIVSAIVPRGELTWFITLKGPTDPVSRQRANFDSFVRSLHFADGQTAGGPSPTDTPAAQSPAPSDKPAGATGANPIAAYHAPDDWKPSPANNDMRVLGFAAGPALITVDRLPAGGMGSLLATVNMWRGQVGLAALADEQAVKPDGAIMVDGRAALLFDLTGPSEKEGRRLIIAMTRVGADDWFFKLTGPISAVANQRSAFQAFVQSIRFAPGAGSDGGG